VRNEGGAPEGSGQKKTSGENGSIEEEVERADLILFPEFFFGSFPGSFFPKNLVYQAPYCISLLHDLVHQPFPAEQVFSEIFRT
jgi:hypothetical protein